MSDKPITVNQAQARDLTTRIEGHDLGANKELLDLRSKMSPKEYAGLLKTIEATNLQDRVDNPQLPKLLITGNEKQASFVGVDYKPSALPAPAEAPKNQQPRQSEGRKSPSAEREYTNSATDRERMWNDFFGQRGK